MTPRSPASLGRRAMLKMSGALLGAAILPKSMSTIAVQPQGITLENTPMSAYRPVAQQASSAPAIGKPNSIGLALSTEQFPVNELVKIGAAADAGGFDLVWSSDHFQPWQQNEGHSGQAWLMLAALAQGTKISFGTGVTCPTYRYRPAVVAEAFASLGLLYPGRVFLGLGSGEALNEQAATGEWGKYPERAARLIEAVQIIRELWTGKEVSFQGKYFQVPKARLYDLPASPVPIYIAASGPKSFALAGQYGDGLICSSTSTVVDPKLRGIFNDAATKAGKDPTKMAILVENFVFVGERTDPELQKAAELWRFTPKSWSKYVNNPDPVSINQQADQEVPLDEVINNWVVSSDPQDHAKKLTSLFDAGVTQVFVHSAQADQQKVIDFYSKQVFPLVRKQAAVSQA